ncbi:AAA family ATPase [uncultured Sphingomonas sp.]|uniref:AAA family ATPase n=1 Tax=uncultured Sphingomonas sp. TaxID=158754 RepID=UPI0025924880|nr:AAA family ATPase [uncultured Sphingomonas sp.]
MPAPAWFRDYVDTAHALGARPLEISAAQVMPHVNEWLEANADAFVAELMSLESTTIGRLSFNFSGSVWLSPRTEGPVWTRGREFENLSLQAWGFSSTEQFEEDENKGSIHVGDMSAADQLFGAAVQFLLKNDIGSFWSDALYIPAARTGLVLALKDLAASVMKTFGLSRDELGPSRFTLPMITFLSSLIRDTDARESRTSNVADFLEQSILSGHINVEGKGAPTFSYTPSGSDMQLPMHAVSSMVTELAPVLSLLRGAHFDGGLVIEEPEAHLHLSAQRCMARALVKLVNSGIPVVLTTHSDTFVQQLNLLMQLHSRPDSEKLATEMGYAHDELLDQDKVAVYEFILKNNKTEVVLAEKTVDGFVISSLNETLVDLAHDVLQAAEL